MLLFIGLGVAWGIPYALTKIAVSEISPQMLVLACTSIAPEAATGALPEKP